MAQNTWKLPDTEADINLNIGTYIKDDLENLQTKWSGATDPEGTAAGAVAFQDWVDTSGATPIWKVRNEADTAWITIGDLVADLGHLRTDGANAMTANLDFGSNALKDPNNATPSAAPSGTPQKRFKVVIGGTDHWVPAYTTAF